MPSREIFPELHTRVKQVVLNSVWETLEHFKPQRIGHGVRSIEDEKLIEFLVKNEIHLEICPTCNIQTDIYKEYSNHPVDFLFKSGVSVGINTDGRSLVNVTLTDEYKKLAATFGWEAEHFYKCNVNALSHAFISNSEKEKLGQILKSNYNTNDVNKFA